MWLACCDVMIPQDTSWAQGARVGAYICPAPPTPRVQVVLLSAGAGTVAGAGLCSVGKRASTIVTAGGRIDELLVPSPRTGPMVHRGGSGHLHRPNDVTLVRLVGAPVDGLVHTIQCGAAGPVIVVFEGSALARGNGSP